MRWSGYASSCKKNKNGTLATVLNCVFGRLIRAVSSKCLELLLLACSVALSVSGCASMAPGIQFSKAEVVEGDDAKQVNPAIEPITPALVQSEQQAREQRALEDISALMQTPAPYRIGAGDVLSIVVWDHPELSATMLPPQPAAGMGPIGVAASPMQPGAGFEVDQNGMLDFPYAGRIKVIGLTTTEIHALLTKKLSTYLREPKVTLKVQHYRSQRVYVDGEVKLPGVQAVNDLPMTLTEAINRAGGMNPVADQSRVLLTREHKTYIINLPQMVQRGVNPVAIMLANGDLVRVMSRDDNKVFLSGEVSSPRALAMRNGRLTLNEALGEAGGINPVTGDARKVYVVRRSVNTSRVYQLDANAPGALAVAEGFELQPKDVVYVAATPLTNWSRTVSAMIPGSLPTAVIATTPPPGR
jgi:polysaccharide export outer membrane protein